MSRHPQRKNPLAGAEPSSEARSSWQIPMFKTPLWLGKTQSYAVVIPVINEGGRIQSLLDRMATQNVSAIADIIIVDGGSTDGSLDLEYIKGIGVQGLLVMTDPGKLSSQLRCAYAFALDYGYEGVITIDGNDKDDPEAIKRFIDSLSHGVDFVQASRYVDGGIAENTPKMRDFAIRWIHAPLLNLSSGSRWTDSTQGFRGYSRKMLLDPDISPFRDNMVAYELLFYLSYRAPKLGYHCLEIPTIRRYPTSKKVPTKIKGFRGNLVLLAVLVRVCLGGYNPDA